MLDVADFMTAGPEMSTPDAVAALTAFADECHVRGDTWLERLALQEAMGLARAGNRPVGGLWARIDALVGDDRAEEEING